MRVALAVVGLQFFGHRKPQDPPAKPEGGPPSPFCCAANCKGGIRIRDDSTHKKNPKSSRMTRRSAINSIAFSRLIHRTDLPIEKRHGACVRARLTSYSRSSAALRSIGKGSGSPWPKNSTEARASPSQRLASITPGCDVPHSIRFMGMQHW